MPLVGRTKQLDRILSVIRGPKDSALVVVGARGVGKSALLSEIPDLSDYRTALLAATASESDWPLSGLTALLNCLDDPVLNRIADEILQATLGAVDVSAVSSMILNALHHRSSARTIIVIDDADQLDAGSQAVLGFLARRLAGTDIAMFLSIREDSPESPLGGLPVLQLGPLSCSETIRMLQGVHAHRITAAAAEAVAAAAEGNPLAALEIYRHLVEREAVGKYALPVPLPCNSSFETEFASVLGGLSPGARHVLDLLSLSYRSSIGTVQMICPDIWTAVEELLTAGLVCRSGPYLRIPKQLLRGYVFSAMTPSVRTASHHALARASEAGDPYAASWHRSFVALERQTAFGLLRSAADLIRDGEVFFAVEYIERALTINPWEAETAARLTNVGELLFNRGEFAYARRYVQWAQRVTRNPALILRLTGLTFEIEFLQGGAVRPSMVLRLAREFGQHDRSYCANLLAVAALYYAERWELTNTAELLRCWTEFRDAASPECLAITDRARLLADSIRGDTGSTARRHEPAGNARVTVLTVQGRALTYEERYDHASDAFALVRSTDDPIHVNWRKTAHLLAVDNQIRAGNVRAAVQLIDELEQDDPEMKYHRGLRHIYRVWRAHAVGDDRLAHHYASKALHCMGAENHPAFAAQLAACRGHFALLRGDLAESLAQLSRAAEIGEGFGNPTLLRCEADLVEVLIRLGRHKEATQALQHLENRAVGLQSPWLAVVVARSRAMLADGEQSLQLFHAAQLARGATDLVLERARTLVCFAERLQALGRVRDSREMLMRAKVMFDEAGADAWTQHVDALLLDEKVEPSRPQDNPAMLLLADHERALAKMVARGMRNKEIAATLYVSVRTVEVRLTSIYRKLGVESRAQLTALASGRESAQLEAYVLPVF